MALIDNISDRPRNKKTAKELQRAVEVMNAPQKARDALPEFYDKIAKVHRTAIAERPTAWMGDGVDHINIWYMAKTELGRAFDTGYAYSWVHPIAGHFISVAAFMQAVVSKEFDPRVRSMRGNELHQYANYQYDNYNTINIPNYEWIAAEAMYYRLKGMENVVQELQKYEGLPLDCYAVKRDTGETIRPYRHRWFVPAMEMVRAAILAGKTPDLSVFAWDNMQDKTPARVLRECCNWIEVKAKEVNKEVFYEAPTPHRLKVKEKPMNKPVIEKQVESVTKKEKPVKEPKPIKEKKVKEKPVHVVDEAHRERVRAAQQKRTQELIEDIKEGEILFSLMWKFSTHEERYKTMKGFYKLGISDTKDVLSKAQPDYDESFAYSLWIKVHKKNDKEFVTFSTAEFEDPYGPEHEVQELELLEDQDPKQVLSERFSRPEKFVYKVK